MERSAPTPRTPHPQTPGHTWLSSFRRIGSWLTIVRTEDPVRRVLNQGFALVITVTAVLTALLALGNLLFQGLALETLVVMVALPVTLLCWWLNRRGSIAGAALFALNCALANAVGLPPADYAGPHPTVHSAFIFAIVVASLFIRPSAGFLAAFVQITLLGIALSFSPIPEVQIQQFLVIGTIHLVSITTFLALGAWMFHRALRSSIASNGALESVNGELERTNAALQQLNNELEQRVAERTADLGAANESLQEANESLLLAKQEAEDARAAAEAANHYKTRFLASMSHELRTPLNAIINFAHFLSDSEYGAVTEQQHMFQRRILYNGEHLLGLINDILDLSKIEAGKMELICETTGLHPLFHGVMSTAAGLTRDKGLALDLDVDDELPPVWIDKTRVRQVLLNLLSNAAKFTEEGGITVQAHATSDGFVQIMVRDSGIGISPEDQQRVFEEFQQVQDNFNRSHQGTGLGLSISRRLVEMHGGRMWLESTPGEGSTFFFTIPIAESAVLAAPPRVALDPLGADDAPLVVVIDDDGDSQRILRLLLEGVGYRVLGILDSRQALDTLRRTPPALIILDLIMEPIDGWTLLSQIRQDAGLAGIPVVICSVVDTTRKQVHLLPNVIGSLAKPVRQEELLALVRHVMPASTVLVVDDNPDAREVLRTPLVRLGHIIFEDIYRLVFRFLLMSKLTLYQI